ncbi:MAG: leucyl/phenylalanyl-tRNA--protein transferase [Chryseobacterium sp.]|nr:MAG: leucyl/phenylalanyl-tRNA--protein transferase [Chryseobacterium sp.]
MLRLHPGELGFPDPQFYDPPHGLIAIGGDLSPARLLLAYTHGIFPWFNEGEELLWWCPDPRFVLFPHEVKLSKSMRKVLKDDTFGFSENQAFEEVIRSCRTVNGRDSEGTWLSEELIDSFLFLHRQGIAHSVEVWQDGWLVGGFYGMKIGDVFCGESMFARVSNASKAGFIHFVTTRKDLRLVDCQIHSAHLESLGARSVPKREFLSYLPSHR